MAAEQVWGVRYIVARWGESAHMRVARAKQEQAEIEEKERLAEEARKVGL